MEIPPCFYRISVKALILDETRTKFLLLQEDDGKWELPGGGLDWGEWPQEGLRREIKEETGIEVTWIDDRPAYFFTSTNNVNNWISNVLYEATVKDLEFIPSKECVAVRFFSPDEARQELLCHNVKTFIDLFRADHHKK